MARVVSKTYGEALFELALEENKLDLIEEQIKLLSETITATPDLVKLLTHPKITKEEKKDVIEKSFKGRFDNDIVGLLEIMVEKERAGELPETIEIFEAQFREYKKIGVAYVTSATALSEKQKKQIEQKLIGSTKYESFITEYKVDKGLIGGMVIRIGDRVADSSIRTKLDNLEKNLHDVAI